MSPLSPFQRLVSGAQATPCLDPVLEFLTADLLVCAVTFVHAVRVLLQVLASPVAPRPR